MNAPQYPAMINLLKSIRHEIASVFTTPSLSVVCVLPMPIARQRKSKPEPPADMYEIDVQKNKDGKAVSGVFGFHAATAMRRNEGSVANLTEWDVSELKASGYWGKEDFKAGRLTNANNAKAKAAYHDGADADKIGKAVGLGISWSEKRHASFEAALKQEIGDNN